MCGGGSPSGETRYNWNEGLAPYWEQALRSGHELSGFGTDDNQGRYQKYPGQRIAGLAQDQIDSMGQLRHYVNDPQEFLYGKGNQQFQSTLAGDYLSGDKRNTSGDQSNPWSTYTNEAAGEHNPWSSYANQYNDRQNSYAGDSPQFRNTLNAGLEDITSAYKQGTSADTTRMFNMAGAFGGSAHQNAVANNEAALGKNLSRFTDEMLNKQYDRSAGLEESMLGRSNANVENQLNRGFQGAEGRAGRMTGAIENQLNRGFQGEENRFGRGSQAYENERGRMMQAGQASQADQGLTLQRFNSLMGIGDINRSLEQDFLNMGYNDWQEEQNHPFRMLDYMTGVMGRAQGGVSPNQSYTPASYAANPFSQILGAGLLGYGALR